MKCATITVKSPSTGGSKGTGTGGTGTGSGTGSGSGSTGGTGAGSIKPPKSVAGGVGEVRTWVENNRRVAIGGTLGVAALGAVALSGNSKR